MPEKQCENRPVMLPRVKCEEVVVSTNLHDGDDHRSVHAHHVDGSDGDDSAVDGDEDDDDDRGDDGGGCFVAHFRRV